MYKVLLFAGTSEGRETAEGIRKLGIPACVFTATEYGGSLIGEGPDLDVKSGRMTAEEMTLFFREHAAPGAVVVDATHPYAAVVTENIREACEAAGLPYLRVLRAGADLSAMQSEDENGGRVILVDSTEAAANWLCQREGNILLTTGSKELPVFTRIPEYKSRVYARVLSLPKVVCECAELGFSGKNLICMQGPFSEEMNIALIHQTGAKYLVSKDTGAAGGFPEKASAAEKCGICLVVIGRPLEEEGISVEECLAFLKEKQCVR